MERRSVCKRLPGEVLSGSAGKQISDAAKDNQPVFQKNGIGPCSFLHVLQQHAGTFGGNLDGVAFLFFFLRNL